MSPDQVTPGLKKDWRFNAQSWRKTALIHKTPELKKDWRYYAGVSALILSVVLPLFALFIPLLGFTAAQSTVLTGLLFAGGPEVMVLLGVALLGKETFQYFTAVAKSAVLKVVMRPVSKVRYYAGLIVNLLSVLPLYLYAYFPDLLPGGDARTYVLATADIIFVISMFIMGGELWEKLRRIFIWEGKV